jgi:mannose-6-phosphate isomerase-like protein (cupin superfamily)
VNKPEVVKLSEKDVHLRPRGPVEFMKLDYSPSRVLMGKTTFVWDPGLEGVYGGEGLLEVSPNQPGERHLDSDELLYVISGRMRLQLDDSDETTAEVSLGPGDAVIVPRGEWHRLIIDEPSRYLWFGSGRTELRKR